MMTSTPILYFWPRRFVSVLVGASLILGVTCRADSQAGSASGHELRVPLKWLDGKPPLLPSSVSWGVPWPRGTMDKQDRVSVVDGKGRAVPAQQWTLAYWPDGSVKWTGLAIAADSGSEGLAVVARANSDAAPEPRVTVQEEAAAITIHTGPLVAKINRTGRSLIASLAAEGRPVAMDGRLIALREDRSEFESQRIVRQNRYFSEIKTVTVEQAGPVRAVVKIEGVHAADAAGGRKWLPFTVRISFTAGLDSVRMVHTFVFDGDQTVDFIKGIGIAFTVPFREEIQNRHIRFATDNHNLFSEPAMMAPGYVPRIMPSALEFQRAQLAGQRIPNLAELPEKDRASLLGTPTWDSFKLNQLGADSWDLVKRTNPMSSWVRITSGHRARGLVWLGDVSGGLGVSLRRFWQKYPASFEISDASKAAGELTVWLWSPDAPAMDLRHYDTVRHDQEVIYETSGNIDRADAYGCANTSELTLWATPDTPAPDILDKMAGIGATAPLIVCSPQYYYDTHALGVWSLPQTPIPGLDLAQIAAAEAQLDRAFDFMKGEVERRKWYGFWDFGDYRRTYDPIRNQWMYDIGGHAWNATELLPNVWLWLAFLRTGRADIFRAAEDMTRNTLEVDVYHIGRFAGLGSRHNVSHWGCASKEARINFGMLKRYQYYLTTDERLGDLITEPIDTAEASLTRKMKPDARTQPGALLRIGPDWLSLASTWLTEWERTGDPKFRDYCLAGMRSIGARPEILLQNEDCWLHPDTKVLTSTGVENKTNPHFRFVFGGDLIAMELMSLIECPEFEQAWKQFCEWEAMRKRESGNEQKVEDTPNAEEKRKAETGGNIRATAYAAARTGRADLQEKVFERFGKLLKSKSGDRDWFEASLPVIDDPSVTQPAVIADPETRIDIPGISQRAISLITIPELMREGARGAGKRDESRSPSSEKLPR